MISLSNSALVDDTLSIPEVIFSKVSIQDLISC